MMNSISVGSDPEFFIKENGKIISSVGKIGGSKNNYKPISKNCSLHEDNVSMEITFPEAYSQYEFLTNVVRAISEAKSYIKEKGFSLSKKASHEFSDDQLNDVRAQEFACNPDFNALTGKENKPPNGFSNLRTCGGHVAVGYMSHNPEMNKKIVLLMDLFLGVPSVILDNDSKRRELYGEASAYRDKDFGLEYRSLSNFWVFNSKLIKWVYRNSIRAVEVAHSGVEFPEGLHEYASTVINSGNKKNAKVLIDEFNIDMP